MLATTLIICKHNQLQKENETLEQNASYQFYWNVDVAEVNERGEPLSLFKSRFEQDFNKVLL